MTFKIHYPKKNLGVSTLNYHRLWYIKALISLLAISSLCINSKYNIYDKYTNFLGFLIQWEIIIFEKKITAITQNTFLPRVPFLCLLREQV